MKVGDIVVSKYALRTNPIVNEGRGWSPIEAGQHGVVTAVRQTDLNAAYSKDGKGDVYVDVLLSTSQGPVRCGNHIAETFAVVVHSIDIKA